MNTCINKPNGPVLLEALKVSILFCSTLHDLT